jgi:hypothetical protein
VTKIQKKIALLRKILDDPRTVDGTRQATTHLLNRLLEKAKTAGVDVTDDGPRAPGSFDWRHYGPKYAETRNLTLTAIAKLIRSEINLARKIGRQAGEPGALKTIDPIGDAPAPIRFSVRTQYYSGGGSIDVILRDIPPKWGWTHTQRNGYPQEVPTPALQALVDELRTVRAAYNYDGSDLTTDLYDVRFGGGVQTEHGRLL